MYQCMHEAMCMIVHIYKYNIYDYVLMAHACARPQDRNSIYIIYVFESHVVLFYACVCIMQYVMYVYKLYVYMTHNIMIVFIIYLFCMFSRPPVNSIGRADYGRTIMQDVILARAFILKLKQTGNKRCLLGFWPQFLDSCNYQLGSRPRLHVFIKIFDILEGFLIFFNVFTVFVIIIEILMENTSVNTKIMIISLKKSLILITNMKKFRLRRTPFRETP